MSPKEAIKKLKGFSRSPNFRDTVQVYFVAAVWISLFAILFAYDHEKSEYKRLISSSATPITSSAPEKGAGEAPLQGERRSALHVFDAR